MNLFKKIPFSHENKNYEVRIMYEDNLINIASFYNNYPANGFRFQIQVPHSTNIKNILINDSIEDLVEKVKKMCIDRRWDWLLK